MATMNTPFLDNLPPEIRLQIYSYLLVSSVPVKGMLARSFQSETYNIHTSILRTNRQIYDEAKHVFLGHNTFHITSASSLSSNKQDQDAASGGFEPPLQLRDLPLIRHLEIDALYYPQTLRTAPGQNGKAWIPKCAGADRYTTSISFLLGCVKNTLLSLKMVADVRPYTSYEIDSHDDEEDSLDVKKYLTGFHAAEANWRFQDALLHLALQRIDLRFDFPESYFEFSLQREVLKEKDLAILAGQVLSARREVQTRAAAEASFGDDGEKRDEGVCMRRDTTFGLEEITVNWPMSGAD